MLLKKRRARPEPGQLKPEFRDTKSAHSLTGTRKKKAVTNKGRTSVLQKVCVGGGCWGCFWSQDGLMKPLLKKWQAPGGPQGRW